MIRFNRGIVSAYIAAVLVLLGGAIGFREVIRKLDYYLMKQPVPLRSALDGIPRNLGEWKQVGKDAGFGAAEIESLGTDKVITREYQRSTKDGKKQTIDVHVAYYTGKIDDVPHVPERCWATSGLIQTVAPERVDLDIGSSWEIDETIANKSTGELYPFVNRLDSIKGGLEKIYMPAGEIVMQATEFQSEDRPDERLVGGYFFIANGRVTPSAFGVRALAFNRTDKYAYYCKVQINFLGKAREEREIFGKFEDVSADFLEELMPELMKRLPDWPAIEAGSLDDGSRG